MSISFRIRWGWHLSPVVKIAENVAVLSKSLDHTIPQSLWIEWKQIVGQSWFEVRILLLKYVDEKHLKPTSAVYPAPADPSGNSQFLVFSTNSPSRKMECFLPGRKPSRNQFLMVRLALEQLPTVRMHWASTHLFFEIPLVLVSDNRKILYPTVPFICSKVAIYLSWLGRGRLQLFSFQRT